jgi:hypothetical protein
MRFEAVVPPASNNFGLKLHGTTHNDFVAHVRPDEWTYVSAVGPATGGDDGHILLIFDEMASHPQLDRAVLFTGLTLEVFYCPSQAPSVLTREPTHLL